MHELPLCEAVLSVVCDRAGDRIVDSIHVTVGSTHRVAAAAFQQLFSQAAAETVASDAVIEITVVAPTFSCRCGASGVLSDPIPLCPDCDDAVRPEGGDELVVTAVGFATS